MTARLQAKADEALDAAVWALLCDSRCADDFRNYLRQFFFGAHRYEAVERLVELNDADVAETSPLYPRAFALLRAHAEAGERNAQFHLGKAFTEGIGTPIDKENGERWYRLAIRQGELRAHINLCNAILRARSTLPPERIDEALNLARQAVEAGEPGGLSILADEKLRAAPDTRDVAGAIEMLQDALAQGDTKAALRLAEIFRYGRGVRQNIATADELTLQAAKAGDSVGFYHLGFYAERDADDASGAEAARYSYEQGAAMLDRDCLRELGLLFLRGEHFPKDGAAGVGYLKQAAALDDADAMRYLGITFLHGVDVVRNGAVAFRWFERALAAGDSQSTYQLGYCCECGIGTTVDLVAAAEHYETSARAGDARAQRALAVLLLDEQSELRNPARAMRWLHLAVLQKEARAMALLGRIYEFGDGVPADIDRAVALYRQAAAADDVFGLESLATCCLKGSGMPFDPAEAAWLLDKAAAGGSARALFMIGAMFQRGMGVERDAGEASRWFLAAAEAGDGNAQFEIGRAYLEGDGLAINADEAARWLQAAVESGIGEAHAMLERAKMRLSHAAPGETATANELAICKSKAESTSGIVHSLRPPRKGEEMEGAPA